MANQNEIAQRIVEAVLAQKLAPGERLGEQELADLYGVSRTLVREALMQVQARGFVEVRARKGWYVVEPSLDEARDAFAARRAVEYGLLAGAAEQGRPLQSVVKTLRRHIGEEKSAIDGSDVANRAFLLADFHVCLAECFGHRVLAGVLRDLTARTTIVATLYQSSHDARQSCAEHEQIVDALDGGRFDLAAQRMLDHIGSVESALGKSLDAQAGSREKLRATLAPLAAPPRPTFTEPTAR